MDNGLNFHLRISEWLAEMTHRNQAVVSAPDVDVFGQSSSTHRSKSQTDVYVVQIDIIRTGKTFLFPHLAVLRSAWGYTTTYKADAVVKRNNHM